MKRFLSLLALGVSALAVSAQSLNINHSGIQTSYNASDVTDVTFSTTESASQLSVNKTDATSQNIDMANVTSMTFVEGPADLVTKYADSDTAQVVFSCMEVNDSNPLQNLNFRLQTANKYLFDAVILFSSNINFSKKEDVVYIHNNQNVQPILNNYEHYIKPLKDKGIKVLLSILGNHDGSGLANLSDERAQAFAKAVADTLNKYNLDGVLFDDEYSEYERNLYTSYSGFLESPSNEAASRLAYEVKKAIGDKWVVTYKWGYYTRAKAVDDNKPSTFFDYVLTNYNEAATGITSQYSGIQNSQIGCYSVNLSQGQYCNTNNIKNVRKKKYGAFLIYNLNQEASFFTSQQKPTLEAIVKNLFDDTLVVEDTHYKKDWKTIDELAEPNR